MTVLLNGKAVATDAPVAGAGDRGLLLGDGVFETLKVAGGRALFLSRHLDRMTTAAAAFSLPFDRTAFEQDVTRALRDAGPDAAGGMRLTLTRGAGPRGLAPIAPSEQRPHRLVVLSPASKGTGNGSVSSAAPDTLVVAPFARHSQSPLVRHKTLSYAENVHARAYAAGEGADDAVFLNERGMVMGTTMANLFVETDRGYATPPTDSGCLPGIVRELLIEGEPRDTLLEVREIAAEELRGRRMWRTNSLLGVRAASLSGMTAAQADDDTLAQLYRACEEKEMAG